MAETLAGSCLCGAVRIALAGAPIRVGICHCLDCRKKTGSVFAVWAIYRTDRLEVAGETATHESNGYTRHVCAACTTPLYETQAGADEVEVFGGVLDEPNRLTPAYELWTVRREGWLPPLPLERHPDRDRERSAGSDS